MKTTSAATILAACALGACASGPGTAPVRSGAQEALEARAARVAERDPIEAFRLYRKGAELGQVPCALKLLSFAERREATLSQREYARLFLASLLASGLLPAEPELHHRLALSWHFLEPRSPARAREHLEVLGRLGMSDAMADSPVLREMIRSTGARVDLEVARERGRRRGAHAPDRACDASPADAGVRMEQRGVPSGARPMGEPPCVMVDLTATAWAGGNDRLLQAAGVLAFVVNEAGEPVFRGRRLWLRNGGDRAVVVTVPAAEVFHREIRPGAEETIAVGGDPVSGIDVTVRYAWRK